MKLPTWTVVRDEYLLPYHEITFRQIELSLTKPLQQSFACLGVDPGHINMAVAVVKEQRAWLYEITLPAVDDSVERIMLSTHAIQYVLMLVPKPDAACVEGAAFLAPAGQIPLDENRVSATIALLSASVWPVTITPPKRIRAEVFLDGRLRSQEIWPDLPPNAGSALGCALYAYKQLKTAYAQQGNLP